MPSWGLQVMGLDLLRDLARSGDADLSRPALVAVMDVGCDTDHLLFRGRISPDSRGYMGDPSDILDRDGHGTKVAGVLAQALPENVQLLILKIGEGGTYAPDEKILEAFLYAVEKGALVISLSIAVKHMSPVPDESHSPWRLGIRSAFEHGIPTVAAAGNEDTDTRYIYPASDPLAVPVSAVRRDGEKHSRSNYGSGIRFCAPGALIPAAALGTGDGYTYDDGTSLAAPFLAAAAACLKMKQPELTVPELCELLQSCSLDLGPEGRDNAFGYGMPQISTLLAGIPPALSFPDTLKVHVTDVTPGATPDEGAGSLFLPEKGRKWCVRTEADAFLEWSADAPLLPSGLLLATGNDNGRYPGRNGAGLTLFGRERAEDDWIRLWSLPEGFSLPDEDHRLFFFPFSAPFPCTQFRLQVSPSAETDVIQFGHLEIIGQ